MLDRYHFGKSNVLRTFAIDHRDEVLACNDDGTMPEEDEGEESTDVSIVEASWRDMVGSLSAFPA